jgi:Ni,Fe-hydrogenase III large subunit
MAETIRVRGYREVVRSLNVVSKETRAVVRAALAEAAWPVAADTKSRLSRYQGISLGTIGPAVRVSGVAVTQRARKVTGLRGDFGALQMTRGFLPALDANAEETYRGVELALDELIRSQGF